MSKTLTESNGNEPVPIVCDDCHNVSPILVKVKNGDRHVCMVCLENYTDDAKMIQQYVKSHYESLLSETGWKKE